MQPHASSRRNIPVGNRFASRRRTCRFQPGVCSMVLPMLPSDPAKSAHDRRQRRLLILLALGFLVFSAAAAALFFVLQPETLRIAVGPSGTDDHQVVQAIADAFSEASRTVKLSPITTGGAGRRQTDLAIGRGDLDITTDAQILAAFGRITSPSGHPPGDLAKPRRRRSQERS